MKKRAPGNRTLTCSEREIEKFSRSLITLNKKTTPSKITNKIINQNFFSTAPHLPKNLTDLLILDPPYNLSKNYNGNLFKEKDKKEYSLWFKNVIDLLKPTLKPTASVYICSDWQTSLLIAPILEQNFQIKNRITWQREKGRGAKTNWKNNTEDIWFATVSKSYTFNLNSVKLKRKVLAPYTDLNGKPKDWKKTPSGNFRLTHPSNIWTDITIPFWSMPENTDHPTQKPEKLIAKIILASSNKNDIVLDPFLGSGTTAVVAKKLNRNYIGIEQNTEYCCWAQKRLKLAESDQTIQGYADKTFWERNSLSSRPVNKTP